MLFKPDTRADEALRRIVLSHDGQIVLAWIQDNLTTLSNKLVDQNDDRQIHHLQGAARALRTLLDLAKES